MWPKLAFAMASLLIAMSICPPGAGAVGQIGLYFDPLGTVQCWDGLSAPATLYVILLEPTFDRLYGWEAAVQSAEGYLFVMGSSLPPGGTNSGSGGEFRVDYAEPLVVGPKTILATLTLLPMSPVTCLVLTGASMPSLPVPGPVVWPGADTPTEIATANAIANGVDAVIGECTRLPEDPQPTCVGVVPVSRQRWGTLKSMYR